MPRGWTGATSRFRSKRENLQPPSPGARAIGMRGFNLTIPHKVAVIELLDGTV